MYSISVLMLYDIFKVIQNNNILNSAISSISLEKASLSLPLFPLYVHFLFFLSLIFLLISLAQPFLQIKVEREVASLPSGASPGGR